MFSACCFVLLALSEPLGKPGSIAVFPEKVHLSDPWSIQRIVVYKALGGVPLEPAKGARIGIEPPFLADIEGESVRPRDNGKGSITVTVDGLTSRIPLVIEGQKTGIVPDFCDQVEPVLTGLGCNSGACHGALAGKGGFKLSLRAYDTQSDHNAIAFQMLGRRIDRHEASKSLLLRKALGEIPHGGGKKLVRGSVEHELLRAWIAAGAPNDPRSDSQFVALNILPPLIRMRESGTGQVIAMAQMRDGTLRDVTRMAKFTSANETVAGAGQEGMVTAAGMGESAISAWFNNMVAVSRVQVPFPSLGESPANRPFQPINWIDEVLAERWRNLNIEPSPGATDDEFLRRLWLDCLGTLPGAGLLQEFRKDDRPNKREMWIERALESEQFVDYWSYKWSDLFLVRSGRLQQPAVWSFYQAIRQAVRSNRGWDEVCRDILLANGSTLASGFGNFFVLHRDPSELAESVAVTFTGQSIGCAKCHNHPLEKWTQDQFWSFTNLFGRVGLKAGEFDGEMLVVSQPFGDVPHQRTGKAVAPAPLDGPAIALGSPVDRRDHFVRWLLSPENPFFARAQANRIWRHFFSRGLVEPDDDLRQTNPGVLGDLLTRLAREFRESGYDNKKLIRLILRSRAYQLSSRSSRNNARDESFFSRYYSRRMAAEVLLDSYSQITGVPTVFDAVTPGGGNGTTQYSGYPAGIRAIQLPDVAVASHFLDSFGRPERLQACSCERAAETGISQVLQITNGKILNEKLTGKGGSVVKGLESGQPAENLIRTLFRDALCREPTPAEMAAMTGQFTNIDPGKRREVLEDIYWAVLSSKEFLLIQ